MAIYMKVDGIDGHVTTKGYEKWIELNSLHFSVNRKLSTKPGNVYDRESTKPVFTEVMVDKSMDKTTPKLFEQACVGKAISKVEIHICQTGTDKISPYMQYTLHDVLMSHYQVLGEDKCEGAAPTESASLNFDKIEMKYTPFDAKHNAGSPIPAGYDLSTGTKI